jgi:ureidoglycolate lyase
MAKLSKPLRSVEDFAIGFELLHALRMDQRVIDYLNPDIPDGVRVLDVPLVRATRASMKGFGEIVQDPKTHRVEIVTWPAPGWRRLDAGTGTDGGTTEGVFACEWRGNELIGRNEAVGGHYVIGFRDPPETARQGVALSEGRVLLWHCNYHPDGGQLFWPMDGQPFAVPVAPPGDDVKPEDFVAFWSDGTFGIYIHPGIWHEGVFPVTPGGRFLDKQGKVHARISCDLAREFGVLLGVALPQAM